MLGRSKKKHSSIAIRHSNHVEDFVRGRSSSMVTTTYSRTLFLVFGLCCMYVYTNSPFSLLFCFRAVFSSPFGPKTKDLQGLIVMFRFSFCKHFFQSPLHYYKNNLIINANSSNDIIQASIFHSLRKSFYVFARYHFHFETFIFIQSFEKMNSVMG